MKRISLLFLISIFLVNRAAAQEQGPVSVSVIGYLGVNGTRSTGHSLQLKLAYHINRFSIGTGISYFNSGFEKQGPSLTTFYPNILYEDYTFRHLLLPLTLSYHAPMGSRVEFIPSVGVGVSYNMNGKYHTQSSDSSFYNRDFSSVEFDQYFNKVSLWGNAAIHFSYKVSEPLSLLAGIEFQGMFTGMYKSSVVIPRNEHCATLYFGMGARYRF
jgi:hypothetical protein